MGKSITIEQEVSSKRLNQGLAVWREGGAEPRDIWAVGSLTLLAEFCLTCETRKEQQVGGDSKVMFGHTEYSTFI